MVSDYPFCGTRAWTLCTSIYMFLKFKQCKKIILKCMKRNSYWHKKLEQKRELIGYGPDRIQYVLESYHQSNTVYLPEILCSMTVAESWGLVVQNGCTTRRDSPKLRFIPSRCWLLNLLAHYRHLPIQCAVKWETRGLISFALLRLSEFVSSWLNTMNFVIDRILTTVRLYSIKS